MALQTIMLMTVLKLREYKNSNNYRVWYINAYDFADITIEVVMPILWQPEGVHSIFQILITYKNSGYKRDKVYIFSDFE